MPPPHSRVALSEKTFNVLKEWGIDRKIFSITLDNATANDSMQDILSSQLSLQAPLVSGGEYFHVRCCAHVLNLIVQEGLKVIERVVYNIRESVKWNSTFTMIESALIYRQALIHYALLDANYKYCPSNEEWNRAEKFDKYWKCYSVILAFAIVLDPRYKLQFVKFCYSKIDSSTSRQKLDLLHQKLYSLFQDYANKSKSSLESTALSTGGTGGSDNLIRDELSIVSVDVEWLQAANMKHRMHFHPSQRVNYVRGLPDFGQDGD
ncbi:zinc finger BED domain-containing protein RICESLEEPER 1-like [Malania oleifera]|uniref:zinc finger BED domain-containing protein RICESLEEPER 1-like n=1 Tax=Malania oleifera TaxID=397392 RepID=UPI0025AE0273|nr:zinc finger BED domain-containing protein RICESLEEPER 1-like [Malania oleifera]